MRSVSVTRRILQIPAVWYLIMPANENLIILSSTVAFVRFERATAFEMEARWFQRELSAFIINYDSFKCNKTNIWFFNAQDTFSFS